MFVESMTFEEIRQEFEKDKKTLISKIVHHSNEVIKLMRKTNMSRYERYFDYTSPRKNKWIYHFFCDQPKGKKFRVNMYCYFHTHNSYAVISYAHNIDQLIYMSGHFFTRYFQREKPGHETMHDIVRLYLSENSELIVQGIKEEKPGTKIWQAFVQSSRGVGLGYLYQNVNVVEMRTFVTNDMLKGDQVTLSKQLEERFKLHCVRNSPGEIPAADTTGFIST